MKTALRSVDEAIEALVAGARPVTTTESIETAAALGRVLAEDLQAGIDSPPFDNSAVDGYAFAASDLRRGLEDGLILSDRYIAGAMPGVLSPGCAARVFTGSAIPAGADMVAMQEYCAADEGRVHIRGSVSAFANVRRRGEDIRSGDCVLPRGRRLRPQDLGLAAALGRAMLRVYRRPRVAILCTGNELTAPGAPLPPGHIHDTNGVMLAGLAQSQGCIVAGIERVADDIDATVMALTRLAAAADVVITSGGVSVGEEDHVKTALTRCGQMAWWKVAIKPGKPFACGTIADTPLLGLPGNPVSAFVTFCVLARPFLRRLQGIDDVLPAALPFPARFERAPGARREYLRVRLEGTGADAGLALAGPQGSGMLTTIAQAHGLAVVPEGLGVRDGELLDYLPFDQLLS